MVEAIPNTCIFCRWTFTSFKIVEKIAGTGFVKLMNCATREVKDVSPDALSWNYVTKIPQEFLQGG